MRPRKGFLKRLEVAPVSKICRELLYSEWSTHVLSSSTLKKCRVHLCEVRYDDDTSCGTASQMEAAAEFS